MDLSKLKANVNMTVITIGVESMQLKSLKVEIFHKS